MILDVNDLDIYTLIICTIHLHSITISGILIIASEVQFVGMLCCRCTAYLVSFPRPHFSCLHTCFQALSSLLWLEIIGKLTNCGTKILITPLFLEGF